MPSLSSIVMAILEALVVSLTALLTATEETGSIDFRVRYYTDLISLSKRGQVAGGSVTSSEVR